MLLSTKEAKRVYVLEQVVKGIVTISEAAMLLEMSARQVQRLKKIMIALGPEGLAHRSRGRKPVNALADAMRQEILDYATGPAKGASCAHLSDLLAEYRRVGVSAKTVGRILKAAGVKNAHSHKAPRRFRRRPRMAQEGLMVILDASPHDWLEGRGPAMSLHGGIDDATGKITGLYFRPNEDLAGYLHVLDQTLKNHGVPHAAYTDRHTIFVAPSSEKLTIEQQLAGIEAPVTQFGMALKDLAIRHIKARTPQAKGRVERMWGTLQERLIIEMRLAGVTTIEDANAFLPLFIKRHNKRFAVPAANPEVAYRPKPHPAHRKQILAYREARRADGGSAISLGGETYMLWAPGARQPLGLRKGTVVWIHTHLDGSQGAVVGTEHFLLKPAERPAKPINEDQHPPAESAAPQAPKQPWKPPASHPWKRAGAAALKARERKLAESR